MQQRPRKPGDQAPPFRPTHRNPGKTATTHVKDTSGRYFVHDGTGTPVEHEGVVFIDMSYEDARRGKDFAVVKLKMRQAGLRPMPEVASEPATGDSFNKVSDDPEVEAHRQKAVTAARGAAAAAQARADAHKAAAPAVVPKPPIVGIDPIPGEGDDDLEIDENAIGDIDVSDLLKGGDLPIDDIARARAQAAADDTKLEADGRALYESLAEPTDPKWEDLPEKEKSSFRWDAANQPAPAHLTFEPGQRVAYFGASDADGNIATSLAVIREVHTQTCLTLQLVGGANLDTFGDVVKSVVRNPNEAPPVSNTWKPIV